MPDDDSAPPGPGDPRVPLPPEDRLWRHPSEVGRPVAPGPRALGPVALGAAALVGASSALLAAWALGVFGDRVVERQVVERVAAPLTTPVGDRAPGGDVLDGVIDALVSVRAGDLVGTGVVLRDDGHVVTTAALVGDRDTVVIQPSQGPPLAAEVLGRDVATDIAVLLVPDLSDPGAVIGSAGDLAVGDGAMAVAVQGSGAPEVGAGVVAGLDVSVPREGGEPLHGLIATDIVIVGQVEGAALVDERGAVVGLTTGAAGPTGVRAVPLDLARVVADDIIESGDAAHPWLGVEGQDLAADRAAAWGVRGGAHLAEVVDGSPAADAGLHDDDVVTRVDDREVTSMGDLITALRLRDPGDEVRIGYLREGALRWCDAVLGEGG